MGYHPHDLDDLCAPGWSLRSGYAIGPWADFKDMMVRASEWETLVWRSWCHFLGHYRVQDEDTYVWPECPDDWRERVEKARLSWEKCKVTAASCLLDQSSGADFEDGSASE